MQIINLYLKNRKASEHARAQRLVIIIIAFFPVKNIPKLINQQLKNGDKIVNW